MKQEEWVIQAEDGRKIHISQEDIDDIMSAAMDGGFMSSWCRRAEVVGDYLGEYGSDQISRGGTLRLWMWEPFDKNDTKYWDFTLEKFLSGVKQYVDYPENTDITFFSRDRNRLELDTGNIDAIYSEMIIEYGLWNDQIFA